MTATTPTLRSGSIGTPTGSSTRSTRSPGRSVPACAQPAPSNTGCPLVVRSSVPSARRSVRTTVAGCAAVSSTTCGTSVWVVTSTESTASPARSRSTGRSPPPAIRIRTPAGKQNRGVSSSGTTTGRGRGQPPSPRARRTSCSMSSPIHQSTSLYPTKPTTKPTAVPTRHLAAHQGPGHAGGEGTAGRADRRSARAGDGRPGPGGGVVDPGVVGVREELVQRHRAHRDGGRDDERGPGATANREPPRRRDAAAPVWPRSASALGAMIAVSAAWEANPPTDCSPPRAMISGAQ